jgi:hypothetical protein
VNEDTKKRPGERARSTARDRIRRHVVALATAAAAATLSTTACACDPIPPPATPRLDISRLEVQAVWVADEGSVIEVTIKTLAGQPPVTFGDTFVDVKGAMVVSATGGAELKLRLRVPPGTTDITGTIDVSGGGDRQRPRLEITPGAQPAPGAEVKAWLSETPLE